MTLRTWGSENHVTFTCLMCKIKGHWATVGRQCQGTSATGGHQASGVERVPLCHCLSRCLAGPCRTTSFSLAALREGQQPFTKKGAEAPSTECVPGVQPGWGPLRAGQVAPRGHHRRPRTCIRL